MQEGSKSNRRELEPARIDAEVDAALWHAEPRHIFLEFRLMKKIHCANSQSKNKIGS